MGRVNPTPGQGLAARLVLLRTDGDDAGRIPASAYDGEIETIAPGVRCFRKEGDQVFVVWKVAAATVNATRYVLAVVYVPAPTRDDVQAFTALVSDLGVDVAKSWRTVLDADGSLRVPALDADNTTIGNGVKSNLWPARWRVRLITDAEGALPSGARCVAEVLA